MASRKNSPFLVSAQGAPLDPTPDEVMTPQTLAMLRLLNQAAQRIEHQARLINELQIRQRRIVLALRATREHVGLPAEWVDPSLSTPADGE